MLEENLREHYKERPCSIELMSSGELSELGWTGKERRSLGIPLFCLALKCHDKISLRIHPTSMPAQTPIRSQPNWGSTRTPT